MCMTAYMYMCTSTYLCTCSSTCIHTSVHDVHAYIHRASEHYLSPKSQLIAVIHIHSIAFNMGVLETLWIFSKTPKAAWLP